MTTKSWSREQILGPSDVGYPAPKWGQLYTQNGLNTPKSLRDQGVFNENGYYLTVAESLYPPMTVSRFGISKQTATNFLVGAPVYHSVVPPAYTDVIPRLLSKWRQSDFNAGVTLGEGRESALMIVQRVRTIADAARQIRRGNIPAAISILVRNSGGHSRNKLSGRAAERRLRQGDFSGAFLELQLGWLPLIRDIYALAELVELKPKKQRIRASFKSSVPSGSVSNGVGDLVVIRNERRLHLVVEVSSQPSIQERLGLTDPLTIGWELVPLSFVADWFLPIQKNLETYHALAAMPVVKCIETRVWKRDSRISVSAGQVHSKWLVESVEGPSRFHATEMSRTVSDGLPSAWAIAGQTAHSLISGISNMDIDLRKMALGSALAHQRILRLM